MGHKRETKMKTLRPISIILGLLLFISCSQEHTSIQLERGFAMIIGKISNLSKGTKTIRLASGGVLKDIEVTELIDSLGNFKVEFELSNPQNVQLYFKNGIALLYVRPSDTMFLELDEELFKNDRFPRFKTKVAKDDEIVTSNINEYMRFKSKFEPFYPNAAGKTIEEYHSLLENELLRQDSILKVFVEQYIVSPEFVKWAEKEITYSTSNYLIDYTIFNQNFKGDLFNTSLFPIDDDEAIVSSMYSLHLRHYALNRFLWNDTINKNLIDNGLYNEAYKNALNDIINSISVGLSRDIMCYKLLTELFNESHEDFKNIFVDIGSYIKNPILINELDKKLSDFEKQTDIDIAYFDPVSDKEMEITGNFWSKLKEKYKGKVIYIDIWATWCGPCRMEIPFAIELHEFYNDKDVAFVNLCMSSDKTDWQEMIKKSNITGDNYFFNEDQTRLLRNTLQYEGYPTYLIIDKNGILVDNNTYRPSSGDKIKKILNKYIDENAP